MQAWGVKPSRTDGGGQLASLRLTLALMAVGCIAGIVIVRFIFGPASDEQYYIPQVEWFVSGRFELVPGITMLPGYHAGVAALVAILGDFSDHRARMVSFAVGLALIPSSWALARRHAPQAAPVKAAQALLQPLAFPYLFLVYTEAWSLAALAAMVLSALSRRHALAALIGLAGTLMRQDFIFWVGFTATLVALDGIDLAHWRSELRAIGRNALVTCAPYLAVMAAFVAFVIWNEGVAMADKTAHPRPFNLTNLYFFYLCAWLVFLPHCLEAAPRIARLLRRPLVLGALAAAFAIYWATWSNPHIYNQGHLSYWLHNKALYWIDREAWVRAIAFVPMAWSAMTLLTTRLPERRFYLLHLFAPLFALLHPLVEQRYYLPAMLLYILWREPVGGRWEIATVLTYLPAGVFLLVGITTATFFP